MSLASDLHQEAMASADAAIIERLKGHQEAAIEHYRQAFKLERDAASEALKETLGEPTISVLHRSAATLALEAGEVREAERLIAVALTMDPPEDIANELRDLLENVYFRRHLALRGIKLFDNEFQFALSGPAVGFGIVQSDEYVERVTNIETLLYRTAERRMNRPYRDRGRRKGQLQDDLAVYVTAPRAASFAVTFRVGTSSQLDLKFGERTLAEEVVDEVLTCLDMLNRGQDATIRERIPDPAYFANFVGLAKSIAPDGKRITGVGFTAPGDGSIREVALIRRKAEMPPPIQQDLQTTPPTTALVPAAREAEGVPSTITGRLRFADELAHHSKEIAVEPDGGGPAVRVQVPEGLMSDIVKPMWGLRVVVKVVLRGDTYHYLDIDEAE